MLHDCGADEHQRPAFGAQAAAQIIILMIEKNRRIKPAHFLEIRPAHEKRRPRQNRDFAQWNGRSDA